MTGGVSTHGCHRREVGIFVDQRGVVGEVGVATSERPLKFGTVPNLLPKRGIEK